MSVELKMLAFTVVLGIVQLIVATAAVTGQRGLKWNMGPRDEAAPSLSGYAGRLDRAFRNLMETFPFFAAAVLVAQMSDHRGPWSEIGAQLYFYGRLVYVPLYVLGIPGLRTLVWGAATVGLILTLCGAF